MAKNKNNKYYIFFVISILILFFGLKVSSKPSSPTNEAKPSINSTETKTDVIAKPTEISPSKLWFSLVEKGATKIGYIDLKDKKRTVVFTDSDQKEKIKAIAGIDSSNQIVALYGTQDDLSGKLVSISTDGKAQIKTLIENYTTTTPPILSNDGKKLLSTNYQNNEPAGFSLIVSDNDGSNRSEIKNGITSFFSPAIDEKNNIYYARLNQSGKTEIVKVNSQNEEVISSLDGKVISIGVDSGKVIASETSKKDDDVNKSKIVNLSDNKEITDGVNAENYVLSTDNTTAYLDIKYTTNVIATNIIGEINIVSNDGTKTAFGKATSLIALR